MNPERAIPLPEFDPTPLPLPFAVLKALLLLTFGLHIFAVNVGVGGSILCVGLAVRGRRQGGAAYAKIAAAVAWVLPPAVTFAITLGVAPLLFVQLLYGEPIYTSTVLLGGPWIAFVFLLMGGYALLYKFTDRVKSGSAGLGGVILGVAATLLLLSLGFLWTNNVTLMIAPHRWSDVHAATPHGGSLNLADPAVVPRFMHMAFAMVAIAGILLGAFAGHQEDDRIFDRALARRVGLSVFAYVTVAQLVWGPGTLLLQRPEVREALLGRSPLGTGALATGVLCGILAVLLALRGRDPATGTAGVRAPLALLMVTVTAMVTVRDVVRDTSLAVDGFVASRATAATDVVAAVAFFVAFGLWALATRALFIWGFRRSRRTAEPAAAVAAPPRSKRRVEGA